MRNLIVYFVLLLALPINLFGDDVKTVGTSGADYPTLNEAFFDINNGILTGVITLQIIDNITESATAELFESGYGGTSNYTSITIYPTGSGFKIDGDIDGPLISLNGATNVTIDGRVNATGSAIDLVITNINTGTSASTIHFINDASGNVVTYCRIMGSSTNFAGGVIFFSTSGTGSGNDGNTIDLNEITGDPAGRPYNAIYSAGTTGQENSGNTISNNNIFDFISPANSSGGINLSSNTNTWTITGNSFYESTSFIPVASVQYVNIIISTGNGYTITDNYLGGSSALCSGTWTKNAGGKNNLFFGIYLSLGSGTASSVQNNTIKNFNWSNAGSASWTGIHIAAGPVNIGTSTGNKIGAATGTGSITVNYTVTGANVFGINIASTGTVDCQNNIIGSITATNTSTLASNITGINKTSTAGSTTISNNSVGSTSTASSINSTSASSSNAQSVIGISNAGSGTIIISANTIANLNNNAANPSTSSRGRINGIFSSGGTNTISLNTIHNLSIANSNDAANQIASVCGIALQGTTLKALSGNTIYNLSNTNPSFIGSVIGIFFIGNTSTNSVSGNFIHNLSVNAGTTNANLYGISMSSGATTYSNNIISLGGSTLSNIYGIYESGGSGNNNNLYYNTIYISGNLGSGVNKSYALYSAVITNTRNFRNNIFVNARSTTGGLNLHYALYILNSGGTITCDYNDYYVTGTGGTLGFYGGVKAVLPIVSGQDNASLSVNPVFSIPGGAAAADYLPSNTTLVAVTGTGVATDYSGAARSITYPSMGAWEYTVTPSWIWKGNTGTDWNTGTNWNYSTVPVASSPVIIAVAANNPIVNEAPATPAECLDLTINSGAVLTVAAGKALKVNGTITNNAGISGLIIKSDATGDGILLNNTASVQGTVELYLSGGLVSPGVGRFHYFVPPVVTMTIGTVPTVAEVKTALGITNFNGDLLRYREPFAVTSKNQGWQYFHNYPGTPPGFTSLVSAYGYNLFLNGGNDILKFSGDLNAAAHSFNLSYTPGNAGAGWNLIGNPYPCNYDLNGIDGLGTIVTGISNTVYYNNDGTYGYWNVLTNSGSSGGYSDILPPMTGFFVKVSSGGPAALTLPTAFKTASASDSRTVHKGLSVSADKGMTIQKVKLVLSKGTKSDETIALLFDDATFSYNEHYDAYKLFGTTTAPGIYISTGGSDYFMKAVHGPETDQVVLPLKVVIKEAGTQVINITEFENLDGIKVVLKHGSVETTLSKGVSYSFNAAIGTYTDFSIIIGDKNITTDTESPVKLDFKTWYKDNILYINSPSDVLSEKCRLVVCDLQGKPLYIDNKLSLIPGETIQLPVNLPNGIYILKVLIDNKPYVSKFVVY